MRRRALVVLAVIALLTTACDAYLAGDNTQGQLGIGAGAGTTGTVDVGSPWTQLEAGVLHTCGITEAGTLWCWGDNSRGQVGNGTTSGDQFTPVQVGTASDWEDVAPGYRHTCGVRSGQMWCWGNDTFGQLGNGPAVTGNQGLPTRVGTESDWTVAGTGWYHSCGIRNGGDLYCWGNNTFGTLGVGDTTDRDAPARVNLGPWQDVDGGRQHTCGLEVDGVAYCWGSNDSGQLGSSSVAVPGILLGPLYAPGGNIGDRPWRSITAGDFFSCGTRAPTPGDPGWQTRGYCWGDNSSNQFGLTDQTVENSYAVPTQIGQGVIIDPINDTFGVFGSYFLPISAGGDHLCAIRSGTYASGTQQGQPVDIRTQNRGVICFGDDTYGQQGVENLAPGALDMFVSAGLRHSVLLAYGT